MAADRQAADQREGGDGDGDKDVSEREGKRAGGQGRAGRGD
jgi:hypothetical protein